MKILLIRLRLIGDVVFTTPMLRALKRAFPESRLTYLVEREAAPIIAGNPHLGEVIVVPRTRGWTRVRSDLALARQLRAARFDVVFDLHGGPRSSWLTWATGAPQRIGYDVQGRSWQYTRTVHRPRGLQPRHSVANQWELLGAMEGWPGILPDPGAYPTEMPVDPDADRRIADRLRLASVDQRHAIVVIHVSAGNPFRRWPEQAFADLVTALAAAGDERRIILSSGPSDREAADRVLRAARAALGPGRADRALDFGDVDLTELRALLDRSRLFVGGDTGPLHVASTTRTPIVGIYGPTLEERSAPWRDPRVPTEAVQVEGLPCRPCEQRVCEPGDFRCLTWLAPKTVIAAAERALARAETAAGIARTTRITQMASDVGTRSS
jgi:lipopolysaccharide heptosyltransferase II